MIVDDELLAIELLADQLSSVSNMEIVGIFTDSFNAYNHIEELKPDIVFLDVKMPKINGIELAKMFQKKIPRIKIVFVTAYSDYAIHAFELDAVDFITKPVKKDRLLETLQRLNKGEFYIPKRKVMVCCFRSLDFYDENTSEKIEVKWRTSVAKEIFLYLLHHRGKSIRKDAIIDEFWPEVEPKLAFSQLYTTIYTIRKTLEDIECNIIIENSEHNYKLNMNGVSIDTEKWEENLENLPPISKKTYLNYINVFNVYKGAYLELDHFFWTESEQQRLRIMWLRTLKTISDYLIRNREVFEAILLHLKAIDIDPLHEASYFMLMKLYNEIGDRSLVRKYYVRLKMLLANELGVEPDETVQSWFRNWEKGQCTLGGIQNTQDTSI